MSKGLRHIASIRGPLANQGATRPHRAVRHRVAPMIGAGAEVAVFCFLSLAPCRGLEANPGAWDVLGRNVSPRYVHRYWVCSMHVLCSLLGTAPESDGVRPQPDGMA